MSPAVNTSRPRHACCCYVTARNELYGAWSHDFGCSQGIKDFLACKKKKEEEKSWREERREEQEAVAL